MNALLLALGLAIALALAGTTSCVWTPHAVHAVQVNQPGEWALALWASNRLTRLFPLLSLCPAVVAIAGAIRTNSTPVSARAVLLGWAALTALVLTPAMVSSGFCVFRAVEPAFALGCAACVASAILATRMQVQLFADGRSRIPPWAMGVGTGMAALLGPLVALPALWVCHAADRRPPATD